MGRVLARSVVGRMVNGADADGWRDRLQTKQGWRRVVGAVWGVVATTWLFAGPSWADSFAADSSDPSVWLVCQRTDPLRGEGLVFAVLDERGKFVVSRKIPLQVGEIQWTAVRGKRLHVIYDDGEHKAYTAESGAFTELRLPDNYVPEAFAADVTGDSVYAVVPTWLAVKIPVATTGPTTQAEGEVQPPATTTRAAEGGYSVVRYRRGHWSIVAGIEDVLIAAEPRFLLSAADAKLDVLIRESDGGEIRHARLTEAGWQEQPVFGGDWEVRLRRLFSVPGEAKKKGPRRLVLLVEEPIERGRRVLLRLAAHDGKAWRLTEPLDDDEGSALQLPPKDVSAAVVGDRVAIFHRADDGRVLWAKVDSAGETVEPFRSVEVFEPVPTPAVAPEVQRLLTPALFIIIFVLFWRRRDAIVEPVELGAGLELAALWRRGAAVAIDAAPVAAMTLPFWWPTAEEEKAAWARMVADPTTITASLYIHSWIIRGVYVLYCGVFEGMSGRTPGKMITGCRVADYAGREPSAGQIGVRNLTRLVELEPLLWIWWALILVLLTRNRQRLGDILARTVVVERAPVMPTDEDLSDRE